MKNFGIVKALCEKQHGVVARRQLLEVGCDSSSIERLLKSGIVEKGESGVYVISRNPMDWKQKASIAVLASGRQTYLSHDSVLVYKGLISDKSSEWDYLDRKYKDRLIHIVSRSRSKPKFDIISHRVLSIDQNEVELPKIGIPYLNLETSFIFAAKNLDQSELDFAFERALRMRLIDMDSLTRKLNRYSKTKSACVNKIRDIAEHYLNSLRTPQRHTESVLEKRVQRVLSKNKYFNFVPQYQLEIRGNTYRLDFADPSKRLAIEVDGFEFHRNRHTYDSDRFRQNDLISAGWRVFRITSKFSESQILATLSRFKDEW